MCWNLCLAETERERTCCNPQQVERHRGWAWECLLFFLELAETEKIEKKRGRELLLWFNRKKSCWKNTQDLHYYCWRRKKPEKGEREIFCFSFLGYPFSLIVSLSLSHSWSLMILLSVCLSREGRIEKEKQEKNRREVRKGKRRRSRGWKLKGAAPPFIEAWMVEISCVKFDQRLGSFYVCGDSSEQLEQLSSSFDNISYHISKKP